VTVTCDVVLTPNPKSENSINQNKEENKKILSLLPSTLTIDFLAEIFGKLIANLAFTTNLTPPEART